ATGGFALDCGSQRARGWRSAAAILPAHEAGQVGASAGNGTDGGAGPKVESTAAAADGVGIMTDALVLSSRLYRRMLILYPEDLRRDYGAEMALVFADDLAAARRERGMRGVVRVWRCALA